MPELGSAGGGEIFGRCDMVGLGRKLGWITVLGPVNLGGLVLRGQQRKSVCLHGTKAGEYTRDKFAGFICVCATY